MERLSVTPGGRDLVRASRDVIERAQPSDAERLLLGDRWYSNLTETNWYHFLRAAGWNQAVDMRENDQRWTDVRGMRVTAGTPHCPATPDSFERITKPWGKKDDFHELVARRQDWALKLHAEDSARGTRRYMCPALAGTLRCPLRPASLVMPADRPLVEKPPGRRDRAGLLHGQVDGDHRVDRLERPGAAVAVPLLGNARSDPADGPVHFGGAVLLTHEGRQRQRHEPRLRPRDGPCPGDARRGPSGRRDQHLENSRRGP